MTQGAKPKEQVFGLVVHKSQRQKQKEILINKRMGKKCYTFSVVTADGKSSKKVKMKCRKTGKQKNKQSKIVCFYC